MAVDGIRVLKKVDREVLKAFFVVSGFKGPSSKTIEWNDDTEVQWALCSETRPLVMSFSATNSSGKEEFVVSGINHGDGPPVMASVGITSLHEFVCKTDITAVDKIDDTVVRKLEQSVKAPFDVFSGGVN